MKRRFNNRHQNAMILADILACPELAVHLDDDGWIALLTIARAEQLIGTLADRLSGQDMPAKVQDILSDVAVNAQYQRRSALWEANRAAAGLKDYAGKTILMKGTAYHAANLQASRGRHVGDLDIMVAESDLPQVESAIMAAGWEWVKEDDYDDAYYRDYMHELPPLIHKERDRMADVHHTILPKTAKPTPNAAAMLDNAMMVDNGLYIFAPEDMMIHCAAHAMADGDLAGGMRNLWDFHCLMQEFAKTHEGFESKLKIRAEYHQLWPAVKRAKALSDYLYGDCEQPLSFINSLYVRRVLARNGYGQQPYKFTRFAFYIRSHWLRMPPLMLAKHLWTKWRKGHKPVT